MKQSLFARGCECLHVSFENGLEGLFGFPFGVLGREDLDPVDSKEQLKINRLLRPQGAVVIEDGDALRLGYEILPTLRGNGLDEVDNGLFGLAVVPRREGVGCNGRSRDEQE